MNKQRQNDLLRCSASMMLSDDYRERFKAECAQAAVRTIRLREMLRSWDAGELSFDPKCSRDVLGRQLAFMEGYLTTLVNRAASEGIDLPDDVASV